MTAPAPGGRPLLRRSLAVVYRFHDVFYLPFTDLTPPIRSPLSVSIPSKRWTALSIEEDATHRFSAMTLKEDAPSGTGLAVEVTSLLGDYVNHEPITVDLPRSQSTPPKRGDFLLLRPLWPTVAFRPPPGETAVRGQILGNGPVAGLKVILFTGAAPPPGGPYAVTDEDGQFLFRFPLLENPGSAPLTLHISVSGASGPVPVTPSAVVAELGETQICLFQRT